MQLAGEVLKYLNDTITNKGAKGKLGIQFGAYATFLSFFGLADLPKNNTNFTGVVDYASSMSFELFTTADLAAGAFPATQDLQVRFLFHNGTASNASSPTVYPLFGGNNEALSWTDFQNSLNRFAITTTEQWCKKCGNSTGSCAANSNNNNAGNSGNAGANQQKSSNGISPAIGGVIGAMVTLAVILGSLALFMLIGGFRLVSKKNLAGRAAAGQGVEPKA